MLKHRVWYIPPESHTRAGFRPEVFAALRDRYDVTATVGYMIAVSRRWFEQMRHIRETGGWRHPEASSSRQFLRGATVGLVSASTVAREVIRLLRPFDLRILLYDPYLGEAGARALGV